MKRQDAIIFFLFVLVSLASCSANDADSLNKPTMQSKDTTIQSRGVAIPMTYVAPVAKDSEQFPLVVMAHGHGGSREEGGGYRLTAETLAQNGIASIRMDFPGCGDSTESFTENNLSNMLLDLQAARAFVATKAEIDQDRVGLIGYSMGGRLVVLLAEIDPSYKAMVAWTPAVANGAMREINSLGGPDAYNDLKERARQSGMAEFTTRWGSTLQLGYQWFIDLEETQPLESLATFRGPLLVLYGDKDDVVVPATSEAAIAAAKNSSEVIRHVVAGADHALGFYTNEPEIATEVVETTVEFLRQRL